MKSNAVNKAYQNARALAVHEYLTRKYFYLSMSLMNIAKTFTIRAVHFISVCLSEINKLVLLIVFLSCNKKKPSLCKAVKSSISSTRLRHVNESSLEELGDKLRRSNVELHSMAFIYDSQCRHFPAGQGERRACPARVRSKDPL